MDNLDDLTFLMPLRIDSVTRLENTLAVVDFLLKNFSSEVKILEASDRNTGLLQRLLPSVVKYEFVEDLDNIFHRTKYINHLVRSVDTKFVGVWDTDIIVPAGQVFESYDLMSADLADFVTPFKDKFLDTSTIVRSLYLQTRDIEVLRKSAGKMKHLYNPNPVGGVFFAQRNKYILTGMENENFYGWGREDGDRVNRWKILGFKHEHVDGVLYHLSHERGQNSKFHSPNQDNRKIVEVFKSVVMSKEELRNEVKKW
ncbi:galactosyltransferase-related protein [Algoriphagus resistens]|uniref:galactosyltransferase-related protein n=1 Tax=Algoriphagus resistens TaxID=1750590 RepID=UPI0007168B03|nr:galactosyltransferase-related protein [Algoriphagus resistens]